MPLLKRKREIKYLWPSGIFKMGFGTCNAGRKRNTTSRMSSRRPPANQCDWSSPPPCKWGGWNHLHSSAWPPRPPGTYQHNILKPLWIPSPHTSSNNSHSQRQLSRTLRIMRPPAFDTSLRFMLMISLPWSGNKYGMWPMG